MSAAAKAAVPPERCEACGYLETAIGHRRACKVGALQAIFASGVAMASALPPMTPAAAARLVPLFAAAQRQDSEQERGAA